jgi:hypothetical protein
MNLLLSNVTTILYNKKTPGLEQPRVYVMPHILLTRAYLHFFEGLALSLGECFSAGLYSTRS